MDSVQTETPEPQESAAPWYQRVLPVTGVVVLVIALAALVVPAFRDQVQASFSRQPDPYVELYFTRTPGPVAQAVCVRRGATVGVRFVIASHLERNQAVAWRAVVDPAGKGKARGKAGTVGTTPGKFVEVKKAFAVPARAPATRSRSRCPPSTSGCTPAAAVDDDQGRARHPAVPTGRRGHGELRRLGRRGARPRRAVRGHRDHDDHRSRRGARRRGGASPSTGSAPGRRCRTRRSTRCGGGRYAAC